jgi:hypothetical protein
MIIISAAAAAAAVAAAAAASATLLYSYSRNVFEHHHHVPVSLLARSVQDPRAISYQSPTAAFPSQHWQVVWVYVLATNGKSAAPLPVYPIRLVTCRRVRRISVYSKA